METIRQSFQVNFNYDVHFTTEVFHPENTLFRNTIKDNHHSHPKKVLFVIDDGVSNKNPGLINKITSYAMLHKNILTICGEPIVLKGGESIKNEHSIYQKLHEQINKHHICRHSYLVAIGGGAILDVVGLAAATAHRGIRLIRLPTTVLSQNDSGVGVKNGFNIFGKKNFLGTFAAPFAVINDFQFLTTLDDRDWRSGIAEAIKVALIKDPKFFYFIKDNVSQLTQRNMAIMKHLIYRCSELHLNHIRTCGDPFEFGPSRPLDFGHWLAHKIEQLSNYSIRHGEAVAIGIALDSTYSYLSKLLDKRELLLILETFSNLGFVLYLPEISQWASNKDTTQNLFHGLQEFREHLGGVLTLMMLKKIGQGVNINNIDVNLFHEAILLLKEFTLKKEIN